MVFPIHFRPPSPPAIPPHRRDGLAAADGIASLVRPRLDVHRRHPTIFDSDCTIFAFFVSASAARPRIVTSTFTTVNPMFPTAHRPSTNTGWRHPSSADRYWETSRPCRPADAPSRDHHGMQNTSPSECASGEMPSATSTPARISRLLASSDEYRIHGRFANHLNPAHHNPYSRIFRYSVRSPMRRILAACSRLPSTIFSVFRISSFSAVRC